MRELDDSLKKLLDAHLKLAHSGLDYEFDASNNGVVKFKNPSAVKLKLAMQGDDGTIADAVDTIQSYIDDNEEERDDDC